MYTPLEFVEQMNSYMQIKGAPISVQRKLNEEFLGYVEEYMNDNNNLVKFLYDYSMNFLTVEKTGRLPEHSEVDWSTLSDTLCKRTGLAYMDSGADFFNQMLLCNVVNEWKYHKYTYKVEGTLGKMLADMEFPEGVPLRYLTRSKSNCFYVDTSDMGDLFCKRMEGFFVLTGVYNDVLLLITVAIIRATHGRLVPIYSRLGCKLEEADSEENTIINFSNTSCKSLRLVLEDGNTYEYEEETLFRFYANFLLYLQASNGDIEEEQVSKKAFSSPITKDKTKIKNKYREVRAYEVGYRIIKSTKRPNSPTLKTSGKGTKKSPHYRSAHWHHYWKGHGEDKELVLKWVEGIFVGGKFESDVANVREVK